MVDVDPRSGGTLDSLKATLPQVYGIASTPSGGTHNLIKSLGLRSRDGIYPGVDFKGGGDDGQGRGFMFLAPTERVSKTTGEIIAYQWTTEPDLDGLAEDDSGDALAGHIRSLRENRATNGHVDYEDILAGVPEGQRDRTLFEFACSLRAKDIPRQYAEQMVTDAAAKCSPPFPHEEALAKVASAWRYEPNGRGAFISATEGPTPRTEAIPPGAEHFYAYREMDNFVWTPGARCGLLAASTQKSAPLTPAGRTRTAIPFSSRRQSGYGSTVQCTRLAGPRVNHR